MGSLGQSSFSEDPRVIASSLIGRPERMQRRLLRLRVAAGVSETACEAAITFRLGDSYPLTIERIVRARSAGESTRQKTAQADTNVCSLQSSRQI
jgi:hypothetical protein